MLEYDGAMVNEKVKISQRSSRYRFWGICANFRKIQVQIKSSFFSRMFMEFLYCTKFATKQSCICI